MTINGIPFNGGMDSPSGTGSQHIVETCSAMAAWMLDGSTPGHLVDGDGGTVAINWVTRHVYDSAGIDSIDWQLRRLKKSDGNPIVYWNDAEIDAIDGSTSIQWNDRTLIDAGEVTILDWSIGQQTGGAATAGILYTAIEQGMLQRMYDALRAFQMLT